MIKINLVREGRAVRGAGGGPSAAGGGGAGFAASASSFNNLIAIVLSVAGIVIAAGYWFITNRNLADREEKLTQRQAEERKLQEVIKSVDEYQKRKDDLQKRIDLINQLKQNQKGPVRIMDQISRDLPDLVWLDSMSTTGNRMTLLGRALNPNAIALFVTNIKGNPYFEEPNVGSVTQQPGKPPVFLFDMDFAFTYTPKVPGGPGAAGGVKGTATGTAPVAGTPGKQ